MGILRADDHTNDALKACRPETGRDAYLPLPFISLSGFAAARPLAI